MEENVYLPNLTETAVGLGETSQVAAQTALGSPTVQFFLTLLLIAAVLFLSLYFLRLWLHYLARKSHAFKRKIFLVLLPKEAEEEAQKKETMNQKKDIKEMMAVMENLYASFIGLRRVKDWMYLFYRLKKFWLGSYRYLSLEIVFEKGLIKFYVASPASLGNYVEQQIHAVFPTAEVQETIDYNIFPPQGAVAGVYLKASKLNFLPLKTYKKMDADPLEGVLNNLSKLKPDEGAAFQLLIKPASEKWRKKAFSLGQKMHHGESLEKAINQISLGSVISGIVLFPFKIMGKLFAEFTKSAADSQKETTEKAEKKTAPVRLFQREEEVIKSIQEKISKSCFEANLRLVTTAEEESRAKQILRDLIGSFAQYGAPESNNQLKEEVMILRRRFFRDFIYRNFRPRKKIFLSSEELASLWHFPFPFAETPNILWLRARQAPPPVNLPESGLLLGQTSYRGVERSIFITPEDRRRHVYIIGSTGTGKSVLLSNMAAQDIKAGRGICVIDPHGSLVDDILPQIPKERIDDVIYFDPSDTERPIGLNMLEAETPEQMDFAVQEMIAIFYKLVTDPSMIGPMFEHNMRNAMLTLMADKEYPGTLADVPRIFTDTDFQKYKLQKVTDPMVRAFWEKEMAKTTDFHKSEMLGYLISKVGRFVENEMIRNIIGQPKSGFNIRDIMDNQKILLVNLSKGKVGEVNSNLLGLILVAKLQMAALSRADLPEAQRSDFFLYIDEFQNFVTDSIATILAEARKYRLDLIIAHQYIGQLLSSAGVEGKQGSSKIKDAVFGNVGTIACFRIGVDDAETMAKQFTPVLNEYDVMNIEKFHAYVRLLIDNAPSRPFTIATLPPQKGDPTVAEAIKQLSRLKYGRDRALVSAEILERTKLGEAEGGAETSNIEKTL